MGVSALGPTAAAEPTSAGVSTSGSGASVVLASVGANGSDSAGGIGGSAPAFEAAAVFLPAKMSGLPASRSGVTWTISSLTVASSLVSSGSGFETRFRLLMADSLTAGQRVE